MAAHNVFHVSVTMSASQDPLTQLNSWLIGLGFQPRDVLIRGIITLLVLLIAAFSAHWLFARATRVPVGVATQVKRQGTGYVQRLIIQWTVGQRWLGQLAVVSVWCAALVTIGIVWFGDRSITPETRRALATQAGVIALRAAGSLVVFALSLALARMLELGLFASISGSRVNRNLAVLGGRLIYYAAILVGIVIILAIWGTGLVVPAVVLGAVTVALSLALQDVLKNIVAGIYLLIEHPFVIGDRITVNTFSGTVEDIQLRYTALRAENDQRVFIPNSIIFTSPVTNQSTARQHLSGLSVTVSDGGASVLSEMMATLRSMLKAMPDVLNSPAPEVTIMSVTDGKVVMRLLFWVSDRVMDRISTVHTEMIEQIRSQIKDADIEILDPTVLAAS